MIFHAVLHLASLVAAAQCRYKQGALIRVHISVISVTLPVMWLLSVIKTADLWFYPTGSLEIPQMTFCFWWQAEKHLRTRSMPNIKVGGLRQRKTTLDSTSARQKEESEVTALTESGQRRKNVAWPLPGQSTL